MLEKTVRTHINQTEKPTFGDVSCHMDNRVAIVNHKVLCQCVSLTSYLDIFAYLASVRDPKIRIINTFPRTYHSG